MDTGSKENTELKKELALKAEVFGLLF